MEYLESIWAATGSPYVDNPAMASIQAYFDESGKLSGTTDRVVFGGLVGKMDEVSVFHRKWNEILGSEVNHIHMRDAMRLQGAFKGFSERRRDEILIECAKVAQSTSAKLIVSEIEKQDFLNLPPEEQKRFRDPIYGGFEACVRALAKEFSLHDIHIWYDESQEYAHTCLKLYQKMKTMNTDLARRLPSLTFADDEKFPGLQAADMVAYCAYVVSRDGPAAPKIVGEIQSIFRKELLESSHLTYVHGVSLGDGRLES